MSRLANSTPTMAATLCGFAEAFLLLPLLFTGHALAASTADGNGALALAAIVGNASPLVSVAQKRMLAMLLDSQAKFGFPSRQTISVAAEKLSCRTSNVDITSHSCEMKFGSHTIVLHGRRAHELFATIAEIGVPAEGAAGSIFEAVSNLNCTINPREVKENSGGGAHCQYDPVD